MRETTENEKAAIEAILIDPTPRRIAEVLREFHEAENAHIAPFIRNMVRETESGSYMGDGFIEVEEVGYGSHHNNAQRDYMMRQAYDLAVAVRSHESE